MELKKLTASNFLSFESFSYDFQGKPFLIQGENLSERDSQESNGSGKSSILAMLSYTLIQNPLRKSEVRDVDLIKWGEKEGSVTLEIYCPVRKETLKIERILSSRRASKLSLFTNKGEGDEVVHIANVRDGNDYILKWLDLTAEDIKSYFLVSKLNYKSFLTSSNTDKLALISRFSYGDKIKNLLSMIQDQSCVVESQLRDRNLEKSKIEGKIEFIESRLRGLGGPQCDEEEKRGIEEKILSLQKELEEEKLVSFDEIYRELDRLKEISLSKKEEVEGERSLIRKSLSEEEILRDRIVRLLAGKIECPKCGYEWVDRCDSTPSELSDKSLSLGKSIEEKKASLNEMKEKADKFDSQYRAIQSEYREVDRDEREHQSKIQSLEKEIRDRKQKLDYFSNKTANLEQERESLNKELVLQKEAENLVDGDIKRLESEKIDYDAWFLRLKKFQIYLSMKSLQIIQYHTNQVLKDMDSDLRILLEGYKILANGDMKEEITAYVVRDEMRKFGCFSEGEAGRLELALIIAIQTIINQHNKWGGLRFLHIDEVLEGIDSLGLQKIMKSLDRISQSMFITTHVVNRQLYPNVLTVQKVGGVSKIKEE